MVPRRLRCVVLWCCFAGAFADPDSLFGQTTQGSIAGNVSAYDGAPIESATVRFEGLNRESLSFQELGSATTRIDGSYILPLLTPGIYRLRIEHVR